MFPVLMTATAALAASALTGADTSFVRLVPSDRVVEAGDRFTVTVYAVAHRPVNAVDISLAFAETDVSVLGIDTGQSVITLWREEPVARDGTITLSGGTYQRGFSGEHRLATINLIAQRSGRTTIAADSISLLAGDGSGEAVSTSESPDDSLAVYVHDADEDPERIRAEMAVRIKTDLTKDGRVTLRDISVFMSAWRSRDTTYDFNNDGRMSLRDFSIILADYFLGR